MKKKKTHMKKKEKRIIIIRRINSEVDRRRATDNIKE